MKPDFLQGLFEILKISEEAQIELKNDLQEILTYNLSATVFNHLSDEQKESFSELAKDGQLDQEKIRGWAQENQIAQDNELIGKLIQAGEKSLGDFFAVLIMNLSKEEKEKVSNYAKGFLK